MPEQPESILVKSIASKLAEHYDTVQIFCTKHEGGQGGTIHAEWGVGNYYARRGQVLEWIEEQKESTREGVRKANDQE